MINKERYYSEIVSDLGISSPVVKGQSVPVRNCWHFYTSGDSVEVMFRNDEDFRNGMNRIYTVSCAYDILILAFVLMDTHIHFILYGEFEACNRFIHEYVRRTSMYVSSNYNERNSLRGVEISHQVIDDDRYLKTAICYVVKNPLAAGLPYNPWDYPWSSGTLYFRCRDSWTSPKWMSLENSTNFSRRDLSIVLKTHQVPDGNLPMISGLIYPDLYTEIDLVQKIFRTHRAYNFFLNVSKDIDIESREVVISRLTIPINELRECRKQVSLKLFGKSDLRELNVSQRVQLVRTMKGRYNSSLKQIVRVCGLVYDEVKGLL